MRIALAAALLAMAFLPGCQERPQTFHVLPAFERGLLALAAPPDGAILPAHPRAS
ncbi:hypothetical protein [Plastoroseomonas hellenica]|uniref:Lipoprotein n=1 Tax=Plastoroseomonas hellenica TaxID=2687306 RepID=A0ABS5ETR1_9PROT|nr:hypothetical protein [Plastoroseomonas hellenica]MBR0642402.1 hypothetical protein [Plastoroseomonas hellenica]MBR0663691.1 hypothetical protein [Plastoroseomonas hellenica]